ncbi:hypothetical protein DICVIV_10811 [Dictyocaulus viviparus]|uniref:Uncharacterized protein n=1 Tax=Dictyocaulus viviparus TaxID=29172 RepID=A0A0D8XLE4_DICVI|nr:hypothetical protein DICVIV_10811 [Dictyocaulus viviparus]
MIVFDINYLTLFCFLVSVNTCSKLVCVFDDRDGTQPENILIDILMAESQNDKNKIAVLCEEIEKLTREADEVLGEVTNYRKVYPEMIAQMKKLENREKFARLIEAPLKTNRPPEVINVEQLRNDITRDIDNIENMSEKRKALEVKLQQLRNEYHMWEQRCNRLLEAVNSEKYAPIDAFPKDFAL